MIFDIKKLINFIKESYKNHFKFVREGHYLQKRNLRDIKVIFDSKKFERKQKENGEEKQKDKKKKKEKKKKKKKQKKKKKKKKKDKKQNKTKQKTKEVK